MARIKAIRAREILDSRGIPTVETTAWSDGGHAVIAAVPSGISTGKFEALELRDGDMSRYEGEGVLKAVENVNKVIAPKIVGMDPLYQTKIDRTLLDLDGTENKSKLGANAILSVSQAVCELGALVVGWPLYRYLAAKYNLVKLSPSNIPTPIFNLINGGKHGAGNKLDFQEFHLIPSSRQSFSETLRTGETVYQSLKTSFKKRQAVYAVGEEGGFAPNLFSNTDALELMLEATNQTQLAVGRDVFIGLDAAADSFFSGGKYSVRDKPQPLNAAEMTDFYLELKKQYQIFELEDPLQEEDFDSWAKLTAEIGKDTMIVGDDLLVTNKERLRKAIEQKSCNAILVKPNQIGTISETVEVIQIAKSAQFSIIVSHRSGETNDDFIADFAVGVGADYTKFGAPVRGERLAKYNRLMAIESDLLEKRS